MKLILTQLLLIAGFLSFSQINIPYQVGEAEKSNRIGKHRFIGANENYVYAWFDTYQMPEFYQEIRQYNKKTLNLENSFDCRDVELDGSGKAKALMAGDAVVVLDERGFGAKDNRAIYYYTLNSSNLGLRDKPELLAKSSKPNGDNRTSSLATILSEDGTIGAFRFYHPDQSNSLDKYGFQVFDDRGEKAYYVERSLNAKEYQSYYKMELLTNEGELLISIWNGYNFAILASDGEDFTETEVELEDEKKEVYDYAVTKSEDGMFYVTGLFDDGDKEEPGIEGGFQKKMDLLKGMEKSSEIKEFSKQFWAEAERPAYVNKRKSELQKGKEIPKPKRYTLRSVEKLDDGTRVLLAERRSGSNSYYSIMALGFNTDNEMMWSTMVQKDQLCDDIFYQTCSFGVHNDGDDITVLFMDNSSNYDENMVPDGTPAKARAPGGAHVLTCATIDPQTGNVKLRASMYKKDVGLYTMPRYYWDEDEDDQFFFFLNNFKKTKLARVDFP